MTLSDHFDNRLLPHSNPCSLTRNANLPNPQLRLLHPGRNCGTFNILPLHSNAINKVIDTLYTSMLFFFVFVHTEPRSAELQPRLAYGSALPRPAIFSASSIQSLCFQNITHSFAQRAAHICFSFNHFRTLSIATEGVGGVQISLLAPNFQPLTSPFSSTYKCPSRNPFRLTFLQMPGVYLPVHTLCSLFTLFVQRVFTTLLQSSDSALFLKTAGVSPNNSHSAPSRLWYVGHSSFRSLTSNFLSFPLPVPRTCI